MGLWIHGLNFFACLIEKSLQSKTAFCQIQTKLGDYISRTETKEIKCVNN